MNADNVFVPTFAGDKEIFADVIKKMFPDIGLPGTTPVGPYSFVTRVLFANESNRVYSIHCNLTTGRVECLFQNAGQDTAYLKVGVFSDHNNLRSDPPKNLLGDGATIKNFVDDMDRIVSPTKNEIVPIEVGQIFERYPLIRSRKILEEVANTSTPDCFLWFKGMKTINTTLQPVSDRMLQQGTEDFLQMFLRMYGRPFHPNSLQIGEKTTDEVKLGKPVTVFLAGQEVPIFHPLTTKSGMSAYAGRLGVSRYEREEVYELVTDYNSFSVDIDIKPIKQNDVQKFSVQDLGETYHKPVHRAVTSHFVQTQPLDVILFRLELCSKKSIRPSFLLVGEYLLTNGQRVLTEKEALVLASVVAESKTLSWTEKTFTQNGLTKSFIVADLARHRNSRGDLPLKGRFVVGIADKKTDEHWDYKVPVERFLVGGHKAVMESTIMKAFLKPQKSIERDGR